MGCRSRELVTICSVSTVSKKQGPNSSQASMAVSYSEVGETVRAEERKGRGKRGLSAAGLDRPLGCEERKPEPLRRRWSHEADGDSGSFPLPLKGRTAGAGRDGLLTRKSPM